MTATNCRGMTLKAVSRMLAIALAGVVGLCANARAGGWNRVETDHFVITSDGPAKTTESYAQQIEAFRYVALMLLGVDASGARAQAKFDIYLLHDQAQMLKLRPNFGNQLSGYYFPCDEGSTAYSALQEDWVNDGTDSALLTLLHEYSHHLMRQAKPTYYPTWYFEGFAEYMSTTAMENGRILLGKPNPERMPTLREDNWIKFETVLSPLGLNNGDKAHDESVVSSFYAQSWLLAHYMLNDSERTKKFNAYFARVGAGEDPVAAFEPATGIAVGNLEHVLRQYLRAMPVVSVRGKDIPQVTAKAQMLPDSENDWLLNASLLKTCMDKPQGQAVLAQLRTLASAPTGVTTELRLARDHAEILFGDPVVASNDLLALASADDTSFEAHYLAGRALLARAWALKGNASAAAGAQAKDEFIQAYRLRKTDAANLYFMSYTLPGGATNVNVMNAARGAHTLAPGIGSYAIHEALLDIDANQRDLAIQALTPLASDADHREFAAHMQAAIDAIRTGKSRAEVQRLMNED